MQNLGFLKWLNSCAIGGALLLTGCAYNPEPIVAPAPAMPPSKPQPEMVWFKPDAGNEEFQRTRAACWLRQKEMQSANPESWAWIGAFQLCMRANGWVSIPKT